mgnify:CR=1 FL=1
MSGAILRNTLYSFFDYIRVELLAKKKKIRWNPFNYYSKVINLRGLPSLLLIILVFVLGEGGVVLFDLFCFFCGVLGLYFFF